MLNISQNAIVRYSAVVLTVGLALLITINSAFLIDRSPFFLFLVAVILVTRFGGRGPGMVAVFLSTVVADFFIIPPLYSFVPDVDDAFRVATFVFLAFPISWMISALQLREKKVRESGVRYRTLFEYSPDGIVIADSRSYYLDANESVCRMLGYTRDELLGMHASDIVDPGEIPHIDKALGIIKSDADYQREWRFKRKDGSFFPGEVIATKMPDGNLLGVIRDITERKQLGQALNESEKHFRFLDGLASTTRALADPDQIMEVKARMLGEHLKASRCAYADVESDSEQFTILHDYTDGCKSTVGNYQLSLFGTKAVGTLLSGQTLIVNNVDKELLPGDGADTFNSIGIKAIIVSPLIKHGSLRAMMAVHQNTPREWTAAEIAIVQDVGERCWATIERRTAEETANKLNAELEQRVFERTAEFEAANKELESFSYSVSHDLRAPLRHIDGFIQLLIQRESERLDETSLRYLKVVSDATGKMGVLIDGLLAFSRTSRVQVKADCVDLNALVIQARNELAPAMSGHKIKWKVASISPIKGDAVLLGVVMTNLLSNAIKYSRRRLEAHIEIGVAEETDREVTIFIKDNGAGFDMKYADKLFCVFQRLHREDEFEGIGIGLATVQRIVHRHGGRIWAEGQPDKGATFYITLMKAKGANDEHENNSTG